MLNLLQNAIDASNPDGRIDITTSVDHKFVTISVADTGSGIDQEDIYRVFDPFFTTKVTGVGLGLAIVKKVVNDHGGEISVRNRIGGGTEFSITMPIP
jgi:signal transduction histidine kinase